MANMSIAYEAFKQHRRELQDAIDPSALDNFLFRLEEKDLIDRKLRVDVASLQGLHTKKQTILFTSLEGQFLTKVDAFSKFLDCLEQMDVLGPLVHKMQTTYGKFEVYKRVSNK